MTLNRNDDEVVEVVEVVELDEDLDAEAAGAGASTDHVAAADIRDDIEETRAEMGATLGQLGERLDPAHLMDQAKENVREATIGRVEHAVEEAGANAKGTAEMVMQTIRENPIPAAMAGIGLFLLWRNRSEGAANGSSYRASASYRYADQRYPTESPRGGADIGSTVGQRASGVADTIGSGVGGAAGTVGQGVSSVADTVGQGASHAIDRGRQTAFEVGSQLDRVMHRSPLAMGAVAAGLGAVVGALLPETQPERDVLGDASAKVATTVRDTVSETLDKVEQQADRVEHQVSQGV